MIFDDDIEGLAVDLYVHVELERFSLTYCLGICTILLIHQCLNAGSKQREMKICSAYFGSNYRLEQDRCYPLLYVMS